MQCDRTPFFCAACCKAAGGCRSHKPTARDVPAHAAATTDSPAPPPPPRNTFARPMLATYAVPYVEAHRDRMQAAARAEDNAKTKSLEARAFYAAVWTKNAPVIPDWFRLVADEQGKFIVGNSPSIAALAQNGFLSFLDSAVPARWVNHDIRVPISVKSSSRILFKAPEVTDCFELELEISQLSASPVPPSFSNSSSENN
ncbi:hypothetical protein K438DRAFT_1783302 [Mycena galopus ATCC 62051]|nr:hypothetical protein K438DRAFT_1783302 [Mycena galopus ATCC 62051]